MTHTADDAELTRLRNQLHRTINELIVIRRQARITYDHLREAIDENDRLRTFIGRVAAGDVRHATVEARRVLGLPLIDETRRP